MGLRCLNFQLLYFRLDLLILRINLESSLQVGYCFVKPTVGLMHQSNVKKHIHFVDVFFGLVGHLKGLLEVFEALVVVFFVLRQEYTQIIIREKALFVDIKGTLVALKSFFAVALPLLNNS